MKTSYPFREEIVRGVVVSFVYALIMLVLFESNKPRWAVIDGIAFFAGWCLLGILPRYLFWRRKQP